MSPLSALLSCRNFLFFFLFWNRTLYSPGWLQLSSVGRMTLNFWSFFFFLYFRCMPTQLTIMLRKFLKSDFCYWMYECFLFILSQFLVIIWKGNLHIKNFFVLLNIFMFKGFIDIFRIYVIIHCAMNMPGFPRNIHYMVPVSPSDLTCRFFNTVSASALFSLLICMCFHVPTQFYSEFQYH